MVLDVIIVYNFFENEAENILESALLVRSHVASNPLVAFIQDPLEAGVGLPALVHGETERRHFEVDREFIGLLLLVFGIFELDEVLAFPFEEADDALGESG
jgi:hypothetical protein